jgi:hypothetical protein
MIIIIKRLQKLTKMINEIEMQEIISNEFPEIKNELKLNSSHNIYITIQHFIDFTKDLAKSGDIIEVKNCFRIAEKILSDGSYEVRNAFENIYVYSIGTFIFSIEAIITLTPVISIHLKEIFNGSLRKTQYKQDLTS